MSTVLVYGAGGREHALAWKLARSKRVTRLILVPGNDSWNDSWSALAEGVSLERWEDGATAYAALAARARQAGVDLAVIGPDNPLADGIVDEFTKAGVLTFGPTAAAARIEASKAFAKEIMAAAGVPTAAFHLARTEAQALAILSELPWPAPGAPGGWVLKADGLALGKGVRVCGTQAEARAAVPELFRLKTGEGLVIEKRLSGEELSWMAICDGERCALLEPARDHKRLKDGDQGPNTGGMGAFSPVPGIDPRLEHRVREQVFLPVLRELKRRGAPFRGVLYAGLMVDSASGEFSVLEFNARFGDPEAQVLLARMTDDLYDWCEAAARGDLRTMPDTVGFSKDWAVVVVAAAAGYPEAPEKGRRVEGSLSAPAVFGAGLRRDSDGQLVTAGGRVYGAMGVAKTLAGARDQAYGRVKGLVFEGMQYRRDIAGPAAEAETRRLEEQE